MEDLVPTILLLVVLQHQHLLALRRVKVQAPVVPHQFQLANQNHYLLQLVNLLRLVNLNQRQSQSLSLVVPQSQLQNLNL